MDEPNTPQCSHNTNRPNDENPQQEQSNSTPQRRPHHRSALISPTQSNITTNTVVSYDVKYEPLYLNIPLRIRPSNPASHLASFQQTTPVLMSFNSFTNEPPSLFFQALSKLNNTPITFSVNHLRITRSFSNMSREVNVALKSGEVTPPDSLECAPPTYSFVLRQMAARRRPRLMGTFIPSPSYVQHTPPPTYATAFDIYIDPAPPPPRRIYTFGFTPMPVICSECGYAGITVTTSKITACTHICAFVLCLLCCWVCAPLPYVLKSCKEVYHYCRNCRRFLGMYSPTNPDQQTHPEPPVLRLPRH